MKTRGNCGLTGRLLIAAAVFFVCMGILSGAERLLAARCPEKKISYKKFPSLEMEGLEIYGENRRNGLRTTAFDSHLYLDNDGAAIRSADIYVTYLHHKKGTKERAMEVFFDSGSGFREEESVQVRLNRGHNRVYFDAGLSVKRIRIDFFNAVGSSVRVPRIILNPSNHEHMPLFWIFGAAVLLLFTFVTRKARAGRFVLAMFLFASLLLAAGIPLIRSARPSMPAVFLCAACPAACLMASLLMEEGRAKERLFPLFLCLTAFMIYALFAYLTPYAEGPDEAMHFDVVYYIALRGKLPAGCDPAIRNEIWGFSYAYLPILPFIIGGYIGYFMRALGNPSFYQIYMAARMVSVVSGALTAYFAWRISALLFPKKEIRYLLPVFVAFLPEMAFMSSYINSDSMAIMSTSMIVCFWASGCAHDWRYSDAAGLAAGMAVCALTYYNCYGFILMSIPLFFLTVTKGGKGAREIRRMTAFIVLTTAALAGWWFIRNLVLYDGDLLGRSTLNRYAEIYAADGYKPSQIASPMSRGVSLFHMLFSMQWITKTLRSFVAMFSHYVLRAKHVVYALYKLFFGIGALGIAAAFLRLLRAGRTGEAAEKKRRILFACLACALAIVLALGVYYSYAVDFQPQGRYILPMILPLACFMTEGFDALRGAVLIRRADGRETGGRTYAVLLSAFCMCVLLFTFLDTVAGYYLH